MKLKEFFKPDKMKIGISFLLILLFVFMSFFVSKSSHSLFLRPFYYSYIFVILLLSAGPMTIIIKICTIVFITYFSACYMSINKSIIKGIILYFASLVAIPGVLLLLIYGYNYAFGFSCDNDSDCSFKSDIAGDFAVNDRYIHILDDSYGYEVPVCVNSRCTTIENAISAESCERINRVLLTRAVWLKSECYYSVAVNQNNESLCDSVLDESYHKRCIEHFNSLNVHKR